MDDPNQVSITISEYHNLTSSSRKLVTLNELPLAYLQHDSRSAFTVH
jgi:hypothetical protein